MFGSLRSIFLGLAATDHQDLRSGRPSVQPFEVGGEQHARTACEIGKDQENASSEKLAERQLAASDPAKPECRRHRAHDQAVPSDAAVGQSAVASICADPVRASVCALQRFEPQEYPAMLPDNLESEPRSGCEGYGRDDHTGCEPGHFTLLHERVREPATGCGDSAAFVAQRSVTFPEPRGARRQRVQNTSWV
jgi:hypothetical protein